MTRGLVDALLLALFGDGDDRSRWSNSCDDDGAPDPVPGWFR